MVMIAMGFPCPKAVYLTVPVAGDVQWGRASPLLSEYVVSQKHLFSPRVKGDAGLDPPGLLCL